MKILITESKRFDVAAKWLDENFGDLEKIETDTEIRFYKGDKNVFTYYKASDMLVVSYDEIWGFLEKIFGLNYTSILTILDKWFEKIYGYPIVRMSYE